MADITVRRSVVAELPALALLWREGWHEAHDGLVPAALSAIRTEASFLERLKDMFDDIRVTGPVGSPTGFCTVKPGELYQMYVSKAARGTGAAAALMQDGEARIAATGERRAFLLCVVENLRAARFYEKQGWTLAHIGDETVDTGQGTVTFQLRRYEKDIR